MFVTKLLNAIERVLNVISSVFIAAMVSILFYAVLMRFIAHSPPVWSIEVSRFLFIWMIMFAAALVTREKTHLNITIFVDMLPPKGKWIVNIINQVLSLVYCVVLMYQGFKIIPRVAQATSPTFQVSMGWFYMAIPIGSILIGIFLVEVMVRQIADKPAPHAPEEA